MPKRISDQVRNAVLADLRKREGTSSRELAKRHGVSDRFVRKLAQEEGLTDPWSRAQTENATRARVVDMKAARAQLAEDLLADAQWLRQLAREPYRVVANSPRGAEIVTLPSPPLGEVKNAYTALGIAIDKSRVVLAQDSDALGLNDVDAWLEGLGVDEHQADEQPEPEPVEEDA